MGTVLGSMAVRAMVVARWCLRTARGKGLMTETLLANSASSYGADVPELQFVALHVLSKRGSASSAERNWSEFDFIWTKKRNSLKAAKATMLVRVHSNLRLLGKRSRSVFDDTNAELCAREDSDDGSSDEEGASA